MIAHFIAEWLNNNKTVIEYEYDSDKSDDREYVNFVQNMYQYWSILYELNLLNDYFCKDELFVAISFMFLLIMETGEKTPSSTTSFS